jgi:GNAT superfamily N-acetyltransferase
MTTHLRPVDDALLGEWRDWISTAAKRFGATGYGESATAMTYADIVAIAHSPELLYAAALTSDSGRRGMVLVIRSTWETAVLSRNVAKVAWLAADDFATIAPLAQAARRVGLENDVVLLSASPGHSPLFVHSALTDAGFHVSSQTLTTWQDLEAIAPAVARIPLRGTFRPATPADVDAIVKLAYYGFDDQRFTRDPYFPKEWGRRLFADWAWNIATGAADEVIVVESKEKLVGFVSMTLDRRRRKAVPPLLTVDQEHNGRGTGVMLTRIMLDWYREHGLKTFYGGTEKSNTSINTLNARLGGSFIDSNIVYHATPPLRGEGAVA